MPPRRTTTDGSAEESPAVSNVPQIELAGSPARIQRSTAPAGPLRQAVLASTAAAIAGKVAGLTGELTSEQAGRIAKVSLLVADALCELEESA